MEIPINKNIISNKVCNLIVVLNKNCWCFFCQKSSPCNKTTQTCFSHGFHCVNEKHYNKTFCSKSIVPDQKT